MISEIGLDRGPTSAGGLFYWDLQYEPVVADPGTKPIQIHAKNRSAYLAEREGIYANIS
jgi:hypothetical protein